MCAPAQVMLVGTVHHQAQAMDGEALQVAAKVLAGAAEGSDLANSMYMWQRSPSLVQCSCVGTPCQNW